MAASLLGSRDSFDPVPSDMADDHAAASAEFSPIADSQRVVALDSARAVALFGILLINFEFFTHPLATASRGIQPGLTSANHALACFEYVFIQGKVWALFAMLFGAGFAVMMERAN